MATTEGVRETSDFCQTSLLEARKGVVLLRRGSAAERLYNAADDRPLDLDLPPRPQVKTQMRRSVMAETMALRNRAMSEKKLMMALPMALMILAKKLQTAPMVID